MSTHNICFQQFSDEKSALSVAMHVKQSRSSDVYGQ